MNIMPRKSSPNPPNGLIYVKDFRKFQYNMLYNFLRLCVDYLNQNGANIFINNITIKDKPTYFGLFNNELMIMDVNVDVNLKDDQKKNKSLIKLFIPKLIDGTFFILNGNYYYPAMYILDKPISIKKSSILINGLFNSITINIERRYVTFTGLNLKLSSILDLFLSEDDTDDQKLYTEFINKNSLGSISREDINQTVRYLSGMFNCKKDINSIKQYFDSLILDPYTKSIYSLCYDIKDVTVENILKKAIELNISKNRPSFIDLTNKRLIFMELLLQPLFKKVATAAIEIKKGFSRDEIKMNQLELIKNFNSPTGLKGDFVYQEKNGYSAIGKMKTRFINPATKNVPTIVANLHKTHYGKICPISVGNKDVGQTISVLPTVLVDPIGQFVEQSK